MIYCNECKWLGHRSYPITSFSSIYSECCDAPQNGETRIIVRSYKGKYEDYPIYKPAEKNKNNDCDWFEPKE